MCEDHKHLGPKKTTSYVGRNFANELTEQDNRIKQIGEKRSQILEDLNNEIVKIFNTNNDLKTKLSKEIGNIPNITEKSEQELIEIFNTLKEEYNTLAQELDIQEEQTQTVQEVVENSQETKKKTKKRSFFKLPNFLK